jgi:ribonuclease HI
MQAWADRSLRYLYIYKQDSILYYEKERGDRSRHREYTYRPIKNSIDIDEAVQVRVATKDHRIQMFEIKRDIVANRSKDSEEEQINRVEVRAPKDTLIAFAEKIQKGTAILVTDASDDKKGNLVAAFGEQLPMLKELDMNALQGWAQIPSSIEDADSFRGELGGILMAIRFTIEIAETYNIQKGACEVKSDNIAAIHTVEKTLTTGYPQSGISSFDILRIIWKELRKTDIRFSFTWVKGHQDRDTPYNELDDDARANCKADQIAATKIINAKPNEKPKHDVDEGPYLSINNKKIHTNIHRKLIEHINGKRIKNYWMKRGRFRHDNDNQIDWEALAAANKTFKFSDRVILMKMLADKAPTAEVMKRRGQYDNAQCPLCNIEKETAIHIFQCKDTEMQELFNKGCKDIEKKLRMHDLINNNIIQDCISQIKDMRRGDIGGKWSTSTEQNTLGGEAMINGILHIGLRQLCNGLTGTRRIIYEIFKFRLTLWKKRCYLMNNREKNKRRNEYLKKQYEQHIQNPPRNMSAIDKKRYLIDNDGFMKMSMNEKELWTKTVTQIKKKYERLAKKGIMRYYAPKRSSTETRATEERQLKRQRVTRPAKKQLRQPTLGKWYRTEETNPIILSKKRKILQDNEQRRTKTYRTSDSHHDSQEKITNWLRSQHNPGE